MKSIIQTLISANLTNSIGANAISSVGEVSYNPKEKKVTPEIELIVNSLKSGGGLSDSYEVMKELSYLKGFSASSMDILIPIMEAEQSHDDCGWYMLDVLMMNNVVPALKFKEQALIHSSYGVSCYAYCESVNVDSELRMTLLTNLFSGDKSQVYLFLAEIEESTSEALKIAVKKFN